MVQKAEARFKQTLMIKYQIILKAGPTGPGGGGGKGGPNDPGALERCSASLATVNLDLSSSYTRLKATYDL